MSTVAAALSLLVPKLQLGNGEMFAKLQLRESSRGSAVEIAWPPKQSFADKCVPKLELGNEEKCEYAPTERCGYSVGR
jgi:hypothetical protein